MSYFMESKLKDDTNCLLVTSEYCENWFPWFFETVGLAIEVDTIIQASIDPSSTERE